MARLGPASPRRTYVAGAYREGSRLRTLTRLRCLAQLGLTPALLPRGLCAKTQKRAKATVMEALDVKLQITQLI